ncbi:MAG TPA: hypothetical protein VJ482_13685 [Acidimicrobiia bacterium]|nr:hypothetical protein [Acidimicrobiia bacterium]
MVSGVGRVRRVGLVLTCALMVVSCTSKPAATTSPTAVVSTTTTSSTTTTTVPQTTSTVSVDQRIAEVTEIVREVQFGWFDAIYRDDEQALADSVAVEKSFDRGVELMADDSFFVAQPTLQSTLIEVREILIDREDCLAVSYYGDSTAFRGEGAEGEAIVALWPRPSDGRWRSAYRGDVWEEACNVYTRDRQLP